MEFHFSAKKVQPKGRKSALAVSAYISGRTMADGVRINNPHRASDIAFSGFALPPGAHFRDARDLWNAADLADRKKDGSYAMRGGHPPVIAIHADMAVPWGTTEDQGREIASRICAHLTETHGVAVEYAGHFKDGRLDHVHFLWSTRTVSDAGFGGKARSLNAIATRGTKDKPGPNPMDEIRAMASAAIFDVTGVDWDHRSFKRRGVEETPEPKIDRRELRRQQREARRKGRRGPTELERDLAAFRELKRHQRALREPASTEIRTPDPVAPGADPVESYRVDPLRGADGKARSPRFQTAAATIIHGARTQDWPLVEAAAKLLAVIIRQSVGSAQKVAAGILEWSKAGDTARLPTPLRTPAACAEAAAEIKAARAAGRAQKGPGIDR